MQRQRGKAFSRRGEITAQQNVQWVERIREMLADDDVEFVSLDIGHLVGPDNVLSRLEAAGALVQKK